jgi:hypothetical protein
MRSATCQQLRRVAVALALLLSSGARADGLRFIGDIPDAPLVWLDLTPAQRQALQRASPKAKDWPELTLTPAQAKVLRDATGETVRWVFAVKPAALADECTCGAYNLGVLSDGRLAVLRQGLGDHLGPGDVRAIERSLVRPTRRGAAPKRSRVPVPYQWTPGAEAPEPLRALADAFPTARFDRRLLLTPGWTAQRLTLPALPRTGRGEGDGAAALRALADLTTRKDPAGAIDWPRLGARREAGGKVLLLVPGLEEAELGPPGPAWFLLEYQRGQLVGLVARLERGWVGTAYVWPD